MAKPTGGPPTLGYLADIDIDLSPWRDGCGRHGETIKIEGLIARFGRDMLALDIDRHLKCSKCGSKNVKTHVQSRN